MVEIVLQAVNTCTIPLGWNETAIVMIPKINSSEKVTHFKPISLYNVVYKIIFKVMATRLKLILHEVLALLKVILSRGE